MYLMHLILQSLVLGVRRGSSHRLTVVAFQHGDRRARREPSYRRMASTATAAEDFPEVSDDASQTDLLHPDQFFNGTLPYPKSLSPSAIAEFKKCPQSYLFQYILNLKQPVTGALAKGSMCHSALEQVFDLDPSDRSLPVLQDLFRSVWSQARQKQPYEQLFVTEDGEWDLNAEAEWGRTGLALLEQYWRSEDASAVSRPNPVQREIWVRAKLTVDPTLGKTGYTVRLEPPSSEPVESDTFLVRGIIDRLDLIPSREAGKRVALRVIDYKTGKAPHLKYSKAMNEQIRAEAFYQLLLYALLLRERVPSQSESATAHLAVEELRLFYLTNVQEQAECWDLNLGETAEERDALLQSIHADVSQTWTSILELVSTQDARQFAGCSRSFCYCHVCRPRFVQGSVWEP